MGIGSALWTLVASAALVWYVAIWSVCLLGLATARKLFGESWPRSPLSAIPSAGAMTHEDGKLDAGRLRPGVNGAAQDTPYATGDAREEAPGVSILRPLAGLDCNLYTNLCSSFEQEYPTDRFEVILSVMSERDQALSIARQVQARYPHIASDIIIGAADAGVNPKINNLVRPYAQACYDIVWVVDSQVWLSPQALGRAVDALTTAPTAPAPDVLHRHPHGDRVGLVHHVPQGVLPADSWGSHVERAFLSTNHAKMYLAINAVAVDSCVMGKSNMYRKSDLAQVPDTFFARDGSLPGSEAERHSGMIGSRAFDQGSATGSATGGACYGLDDVVRFAARPLSRFGIYLAEDNMLALSLWRAPLSLAHRVAPGDVAHVAVGDIRTLGEYARRRMRWIRVRRHMVAVATYLEPFTESLVAGIVGWIAFRTWILGAFGAWSSGGATLAFLVFYVTHLVLWYKVDCAVLLALRAGIELPESEQRWLLPAWCLRELLALPIWAWAMLGSTVTWRGRRYRILSDARAAHLPALEAEQPLAD